MRFAETNSHKITEGTKEWADSNVNVYNGCSNNCRYCYAKKMAIRFKRKTNATWKIMEPKLNKIHKGYAKRQGRVMFPTSHDITEESLSNCIIVLRKLINAGNEVLVTTKPRLTCIKAICTEFTNEKRLLQFRFTITSLENQRLKFWEPGAPPFEGRFKSLKFAFRQGFMTSVSIEPFLDADPFPLINKLFPFCTESIWIGKMNYIKATGIAERDKKHYNHIREIVKKNNLKKILCKAEAHNSQMLRIKDSIYNYISE